MASEPIVITGTLTANDHKRHIPLTFEVPAGTTRIAATFTAAPARATGALFDNMVCLTVSGPDGPRGARHNNPVRDFRAVSDRRRTSFVARRRKSSA